MHRRPPIQLDFQILICQNSATATLRTQLIFRAQLRAKNLKSTLNPALKQAFEKKLIRYTLVGSALLGFPLASHAGIVYSGLLNVNMGPDSIEYVDIDGLAISAVSSPGADFTIQTSSFRSNSFTNVGGIGGTFFNDGLTPLAAGASITLANTSSDNNGSLSKSPNYQGPWANLTGSAYLGIRFQISGEDHFAWAQLAISPSASSVLLKDFAFNDAAGEGINTGQQAPEPASLLLFATGAAGILALRRRRNAA
jgi:hypothetical protein